MAFRGQGGQEILASLLEATAGIPGTPPLPRACKRRLGSRRHRSAPPRGRCPCNCLVVGGCQRRASSQVEHRRVLKGARTLQQGGNLAGLQRLSRSRLPRRRKLLIVNESKGALGRGRIGKEQGTHTRATSQHHVRDGERLVGVNTRLRPRRRTARHLNSQRRRAPVLPRRRVGRRGEDRGPRASAARRQTTPAPITGSFKGSHKGAQGGGVALLSSRPPKARFVVPGGVIRASEEGGG